MEKDIGRIKRNADTDIIIRIDEFGGKKGLTIREFVNKSDSGFTGFTKSGTRIPAESFNEFKRMISLIDVKELESEAQPQQKIIPPKNLQNNFAQKNIPQKKSEPKEIENEDAGVDEDGYI